jgi:T1SS-143 domain-containing protein
VTATDASGAAVTQSFEWTVTNPAPTARSDQGTMTEDGADLVVTVANGVIQSGAAAGGVDTDPDGDGLTVTGVMAGPASDIGDFPTANAGTQIIGTYGTLTLNADGSYTYELNNDNPVVNALDTDSTPLADVFSYLISDGEGGVSFAALTITINGNDDGAPSVTPVDGNAGAAGHATVHEAGLTTDGPGGQDDVVNGVIGISATDGLTSVTIGGTTLTPAQLEALSVGSPVEVETPQGRLTLTGYVSSGEVGGVSTGGTLSYTYTLQDPVTNGAASSNTTENIDLSVEDASGEVEDSSLIINIIDDVPSIGAPAASVVDEANLPAGTDPDAAALTATGSLDVRVGADDGASTSTVFDSGQTALEALGLRSNGVALTYTVSADGHTLTAMAGASVVFTVALTDPGLASAGYSFVLSQPLDNTSGAAIDLPFGFIFSDADGDTDAGSFQVSIIDDAPVAVNQSAVSMSEGGVTVGSSSGGAKLLANDNAGADGPARVVSITYTDEDGDLATATVDADGVTVDTLYGSLTVNQDGAWSYTSDETEDNPSGAADDFSYTITDVDGSTSTGTQPLTVSDTGPTVGAVGPIGLTLDEDDIPGIGSDGSSDNEVTQSLAIVRGADAIEDVVFSGATVTALQGQGLTSDGVALVYTVSADGHTLTAKAGATGPTIFTLTLNDATNASGTDQSVTFALTGTLDHASANGENSLSIPVGYTVHDTDSTQGGTLTLSVLDDVPTVQAGTAETVAEGGLTVNGTTSLLANDTAGADAVIVNQIRYIDENGDQQTGTVASGGSTFNTIHGSLTVQQNGVWSYTSDASATSGPSVNHPHATNDISIDDIFDYNVIDGDGDVSGWASQTVTVTDTAPSIGAPDSDSVSEANLPHGTDPNDSGLTQTGSLAVTTGADGIDVTFAGTQTDLAILGLSSNGVALTYAVSSDGHTLTALAGAVVVFTAMITNPTSASAGYTFVLSQPLDSAGGSINLPIAFGVADADGDTDNDNFIIITVVDDQPENLSFTLDEDSGAGVTFNTSADATGSNVVASDPPHGMATVNPNGTITYKPDPGFSGADTFTYTTTADDGSAVITTVTVTVNPVSDAPLMTRDAATVATNEDVAVALGLNAPVRTDTVDQNGGDEGDNPERLGAITLTGIPVGAQILDGSGVVLFTSTGGPVTIQLSDGLHVPGLSTNLTITTATYEALQVRPSGETHSNFTVNVTATSYEVDDSGVQLTGTPGATSTTNVAVRVQAVTDPVDLSLSDGVDPDSGVGSEAVHTITEDSNFDLTDLLSVSFPNTDSNATSDVDGTEERWIEISGLPIGSTVNGVPVTSSDPFRIDAPGLSTDADGLPPMVITPPANFSGDVSVTVTLYAQDRDSDGVGSGATTGNVVSDPVTFDLHVTPVGGDVTGSDVAISEDGSAAFLSGIGITDAGTTSGAEVITDVSFEVPAGWTVSQTGSGVGYSVNIVSSTYTITFTDDGMTQLEREAVLDDFRIDPPGHSSEDVSIAVEVTTVDTVSIDGSDVSSPPRTTSLSVGVEVTAVAEIVGGDSNGDAVDDVTMTPGHDYGLAAPGEEDSWFNLGSDGAFSLGDGWSNQDDEETFARLTPELVAGDGGAANAIGSQFRYSTNGDTTEGGGAWVAVTYSGSPVDIPVEYLDTLQFMAPRNLSGAFRVNVETYTVDIDPDTGAEVEAVSGLEVLENLVIAPVADEVTVGLNARAAGLEDSLISLDIRPTSSDPSETFNVTISSIPAGAQIYYDGVLQTLAGGSLTIENFDATKSLTLQPPLNSNDDFTLGVSAVSIDGADISGSQNLTVDVSLQGVADVATVTPVDTTYSEDALDNGSDQVLLSELAVSSLYDNDGSEVLTYRVTGLPAGFSLSEGTLLVGGTGAERVWVLTQGQFGTAVVGTPANFSGTQGFTITPVTTENDGNSRTGTPQAVEVNVTPSAEAGVTASATLDEDALTPLGLSIVHQNGDTDETLTTVWIALEDAESANFTLYLGSTPLSAAGLTVENIDGVDYYVLTGLQIGQLAAQSASNVDGALGSFDFKYEITDNSFGSTPAGSGAASVHDGSFTLTANPVTDPIALSITSIAGMAGTTVVSDEHAGDGAPDTAVLGAGDLVTVTLNIVPQADTGSVDGTSDADGSENVIRVVVSGVPDGVSVEGAQYIGGGAWLVVYDDSGAPVVNSAAGISLPIVFDVSEYAGLIDDIPITIQVQTQDRQDSAAGVQSDSVTWHLTTNFAEGGATVPAQIDQWAYNGAHASEDSTFQLSDIVDAAVTIMDPAVPNTFTVTLGEVPAGTTITGMVMTVVDGVEIWTASVTVPPGGDGDAALQSLLDSIQIVAPPDSNGNNGPGAFIFDATLTTSAPNGTSERGVIDNLTLPVDPVTDAAVISISAGDVDEGVASIPVTIVVSNDADGAFGEIIDGKLYVKVDAAGSTNGLHNGTLTYNGVEPPVEMVDGQPYYVISGVSAGVPIELVYTPDNSTAGQVSFSAVVMTQENNSGQVVTATASGVADVIIINNGVTVVSAPSTGSESSQVPITGLVVALVDDDGSEAINTVLLSNVPNGFLVYVGSSAGTATLASNAGGDNTWVVSNPDGSIPAYIAIVPPEHWSGTLTDLTVTVESGETVFNDGVIQNFELGDVTVTAVADGVDLTATNTFGPENRIISLNLNASMTDAVDASVPGADDAYQETTTLRLTGLGEFASFYIGTAQLTAGVSYDLATNTYTLTGLTQSDLDRLGFLQARNALTDQDGAAGVQIAVEAFTVDGSSTSASDSVFVTVNSFAQLPTGGDDDLLWTDAGINGGGGTDTIQLRYGEDLTGAQLDARLSNVEVLELNGNDIASLTIADVLGITGSGDSILTIMGDADDSVTFAAGWTSGGTQEIGGIECAIYSATVGSTDVEVRVQSGISD